MKTFEVITVNGDLRRHKGIRFVVGTVLGGNSFLTLAIKSHDGEETVFYPAGAWLSVEIVDDAV